MEKQDKVFVDGMNVQLPSEKAPEYILLRMGFNAQKFFRWCQEHQDEKGWVNITIKKSQKGSIYGELDTWKPKVDGATLADTAEAKGREAFVPGANDEIKRAVIDNAILELSRAKNIAELQTIWKSLGTAIKEQEVVDKKEQLKNTLE